MGVALMKGLIDLQGLVQTILDRDAPAGARVIADVAANSGEEVPLISWTAINEGQTDHGLWSAILAITIVCDPADAWSLCRAVYALVHSWNEPGVGVIEDDRVGVNSTTDMGVFDLVHSETITNGKSLEQYAGQFRIQIQDWS